MSSSVRAPFDPMGIVWTIFVDDHLLILDTKYLGYVVFDKNTFKNISLRKTDEPPNGAHFDPRDIILTLFVDDY